MSQVWILVVSIALQLAAAITALLLIRRTGWMLAWLLIACALGLMAVRRIITLSALLQGDMPPAIDLSAELVALAISAFMLVGIILIRPRFEQLKRNEESLRASDATYRGILDNMLETYFRTDGEGRISMISRAVEDALGRSVKELIGEPMSSLHVRPERWDELVATLEKNGGQAHGFVAQLRHASGRPVLVESNAGYVRDADGAVVGIEGVARDIDQRIEAEQLTNRLGRIIEDSLNEIYVFDAETLLFKLVNRGARENLGYSMGELETLTPVDIKPEFDEAGFREAIEPLKSGERTNLIFETIHERKDGTRYSVDVHLQLARSDGPAVFFAIIRDTTVRKRTEETLAHAQRMEAVGQLTGGVAHDFNNILTVIIGNLDLCQSELESAGISLEYVEQAGEAARKAATLTQRLLAFSRKQPLRPAVVDLRAIVKGMDSILSRTLREDIDIELIGTARLWLCEADASQLENVLLNLAVNARDAMPNGGKLTIETSNAVIDEAFSQRHPGARSGQYVLLAVSDSGHGMSPEVQAKAFSPFFTTKQRGSGTGLGLSMVYGFVKQSGGYVDLYSEPGQGTTFKIYLPRVLEGEPHSTTAEESSLEEVQGAGECILVVEDDVEVRSLTLGLLRRLGYRALEAGDGESALAILRERPEVELLLADVVLAGDMNGAELGREAQRRHPGLKVLYMSGYTENAIIHDGRLDSGVELLEKPFAKQQLARKIRVALHGG